MKNKRACSLFLAGLTTFSLAAGAQEAPTYRPSSNSQPPVYQPRTVALQTPGVMSAPSQKACTSLKEMVRVVRRNRMTPGGSILNPEQASTFTSPGASECHARAGIPAGSASASCSYAASGKADAEMKQGQMIAHTKDCLQGWPNGTTDVTFMFQSPDRQVMGAVRIVETQGKFAVERSVFYDTTHNPVIRDDNCGTLEAMHAAATGNFPASTTHVLASGTTQLNTPIAHSSMCYAYPRKAAGDPAGLSCTWIVEDKDADGPGKEVLARGFYRQMSRLPKACRSNQSVQPAKPLGNGELESISMAGDGEAWSVQLLGPEKGAPWAVMLTLKRR